MRWHSMVPYNPESYLCISPNELDTPAIQETGVDYSDSLMVGIRGFVLNQECK